MRIPRSLAVIALAASSVLCSTEVAAQGTAFTYQGRLTDSNAPANGPYQMQFKLFDSSGGPGQIGSTIADIPVSAADGIFTVLLDFGSNALSGADRWLEIAVRHNPGESYTTLGSRQQIASSPYSVRTLSAATADNALALGGVAAGQFVQTSDARLSNARAPLPGSSSYIQNTIAQQPSANLNIDGSGYFGTAVGIKTTAPISPLTVASAGYGLTQPASGITVGTFISNAGGWFGTQSNDPLYFFTNNGNAQVTLTQSGNVGIGTVTPATRLNVAAAGYGLTHTYTHASGDTIVGTYADANGGWYGTKSAHPLYFFTYDSSAQLKLQIGSGNLTQPTFGRGLVKVALQVTASGSIDLCYNGVTDAQYPTCGFSVTHPSTGTYNIAYNFGGPLVVVVTPIVTGNGAAGYEPTNGAESGIVHTFNSAGFGPVDLPFTLIGF